MNESEDVTRRIQGRMLTEARIALGIERAKVANLQKCLVSEQDAMRKLHTTMRVARDDHARQLADLTNTIIMLRKRIDSLNSEYNRAL